MHLADNSNAEDILFTMFQEQPEADFTGGDEVNHESYDNEETDSLIEESEEIGHYIMDFFDSPI